MPVELVASDVADERAMMAAGRKTTRVRGRRRLMAERRDVMMPGERMADRLAAVVQEQRTVSHLRERDGRYDTVPTNVPIGRLTNAINSCPVRFGCFGNSFDARPFDTFVLDTETSSDVHNDVHRHVR